MTEKEVQARVDFKMNELLTAVENTAKANWNISFQNNSPKHAHYWEAFNQLKQMFKKEVDMATPFDEMAEVRRREKRDKAVNKVMARLCKKGDRDYYQKEKVLVSAIEEAQNW